MKHQMKSCSLPADIKFPFQRFQELQHPVVLAPVMISHPVEIPFKISLLNKFIQYRLIQPRNGAGKKTGLFMKCRQQILRKNQIADTDRRCNRLGEGPQINHLSSRIHRLQRRNRTSSVLKLRIVIILDKIASLFLCRPGKELRPSRIWHHHAGRKLSGRHEISKLTIRFFQCIRPHAVLIIRNRLNGKSHRSHHICRPKIRRGFHSDPHTFMDICI